MAANLNEKRRQYTSYNRVKLNNIVTQYLKMSEYIVVNFLLCLLKGTCSKKNQPKNINNCPYVIL